MIVTIRWTKSRNGQKWLPLGSRWEKRGWEEVMRYFIMLMCPSELIGLTAVVLSLLKELHFGRSHSMKKLSIISTYGNASQGLHGCPRRDHSEQLSSFSMHFLFLSPFEMGYQGKWVSSLNKSKQKKQDFWFKLAMLSIFLFLLCSPPISSKWQYKENQEEWRA